jgi:flavin reductase
MGAISSGMAVWNHFFGRPRPVDGGCIDPAMFRDVMREIAAPVAIVAAGSQGARNGITATAVCSVSDSPPTVLVCIRQTARAHDAIVEAGPFSINFLSSDQQDVAVQFSGVTAVYGEDRFSAGDWTTGRSGAPILRHSLCTLECRPAGTQRVATHSILFGELVDGRKWNSFGSLLYRRGRYQSLPHAGPSRRLQEVAAAGGRGR